MMVTEGKNDRQHSSASKQPSMTINQSTTDDAAEQIAQSSMTQHMTTDDSIEQQAH